MTETIWTQFAQSYDTVLRHWSPYQELVSAALDHLADAQTVLDQGCGTGIFTIAMADTGKTVYGIDNNEYMVEKARQSVAKRAAIGQDLVGRISLDTGDAQHLPFDDAFFDAVVSNNVIFFVENPRRLLEEAYRVLKPTGTLFISGPRPNPDYELFRRHSVDEFTHKGIYSDIKVDLDHFLSCSAELKDTGILNPYEPDEMKQLLEDVGFATPSRVTGEIYFGTELPRCDPKIGWWFRQIGGPPS